MGKQAETKQQPHSGNGAGDPVALGHGTATPHPARGERVVRRVREQTAAVSRRVKPAAGQLAGRARETAPRATAAAKRVVTSNPVPSAIGGAYLLGLLRGRTKRRRLFR